MFRANLALKLHSQAAMVVVALRMIRLAGAEIRAAARSLRRSLAG